MQCQSLFSAKQSKTLSAEIFTQSAMREGGVFNDNSRTVFSSLT